MGGGGGMRSTPRFPKTLWEIVKRYDFPLKVVDVQCTTLKNNKKSWESMDFPDYPMLLGKSGCQSYPAPQVMCRATHEDPSGEAENQIIDRY